MSEQLPKTPVVIEQDTKGRLKSVTNAGLFVKLLGLIMMGLQYFTENSEQVEGACSAAVPWPWSSACGPGVALIVVFVGWIIAAYGRNRKEDLKGWF